MSSSKSVIVVVPGYSAELLQELLNSRVLSYHKDHDILLPPGGAHQYDHLIAEKKFFRVRFFPSRDRRFFSTAHLRWLREKLRSSDNVIVLITKSPYNDLTIAIICLLFWMLSGKRTTLLRAYQAEVNSPPQSIIDTHGQALTKQWLSLDLNIKTLCDDIYWHLHRRFYPKDPWNRWEILVLVMFAGLVLRRNLSIFFSSLLDKLRGK